MCSYITVFGVTDCEDTRRTRTYLASRGIHFSYVNLDEDKDAERIVKEQSDGKRCTPSVVVQFGAEALTLRAPSNEELDRVLLEVVPLKKAA